MKPNYSVLLVGVFFIALLLLTGVVSATPTYPEPVSNGNYTLSVIYIDSTTIEWAWNGTIGEINTEFLDGQPQPLADRPPDYFYAHNLTSGAKHTFEIHSEMGSNVLSAYTDNATAENDPIRNVFDPFRWEPYFIASLIFFVLGLWKLKELHYLGALFDLVSICFFVLEYGIINGVELDFIFAFIFTFGILNAFMGVKR